MLAELYVVKGRDAGKALELGEGAVVSIGRSFTNDVRLRDPQVSRVHLKLEVHATRVVLLNLSSHNGTFVNGERVGKQREMRDGDRLRLGTTELRLLLETDAERSVRDLGAPPVRAPGRPKGAPIYDEDAAEAGEDPTKLDEEDPPSVEEERAAAESPSEVRSALDSSLTPSGQAPLVVEDLPLAEDEAEEALDEDVEVLDDDDETPADAISPTVETPVNAHARGLVPGYRLEARIGGGRRPGTAVYRATQLSLDRPVAIKVLTPPESGGERAIGRLLREAAAIARLPHPSIVTIHDAGRAGEHRFLVMELLPGGNLAAWLEAAGPLAPKDAVALARPLARGLAFAHERGIVHRAVNPWNVLADATGAWKLVDFGLALDVAKGGSGKTSFLAPVPAFAYLAPEQVKAAGRGDARSDVWSLAAVILRAVSGEPPFPGKAQLALSTAILKEPPPLLSRAQDLDAKLGSLLARCLSKDPAERPATGQELLLALESLDGTAPPPSRRTAAAPPKSRAR